MHIFFNGNIILSIKASNNDNIIKGTQGAENDF